MLIVNDSPFIKITEDIESDRILVLQVTKNPEEQKVYAKLRISLTPSIETDIILWEGDTYTEDYTLEQIESRVREIYGITINENILNPTP